MISPSEYNQQKFSVECFERVVSLVIARMKDVKVPERWSPDSGAKISTDGVSVTLSVPNSDMTGAWSPYTTVVKVPWGDIQKFMKTGKWVVSLYDKYGNKEYHVFDNKDVATYEYKRLLGHTAKYAENGDCSVDWVETPELYSWDKLAEIDSGELCWR